MPSKTDSRVSKIGKETLIEASVLFSMSLITCLFVPSISLSLLLILVTGSIIAVNLLIRSLSTIKDCSKLRSFWPCFFALIDSTTTSTLIHEFGHAIAARLFFQMPISIVVFPFIGAYTSFNTECFTLLGKHLEMNTILTIITICGPAAALLYATLALIIATNIAFSHKQLYKYLYASSFVTIYTHIKYALSALYANLNDLSHDFVCLWVIAGIHPLISALSFLLFPIFCLYFFNKMRSIISTSDFSKEIPPETLFQDQASNPCSV